MMKTTTEGLLPRLLAGVSDRPMTDLESHVDVHGPLPDLRKTAPGQIIDEVQRSGLRGHGGASFPVAKKLKAVASRRSPRVVVVNGTESEPASKKDRVLLRELPHLVIDGAAVAARAVGAGEAIIAVPLDHGRTVESLQLALRERTQARRRDEPRFELVGVPKGYLSGQESALVNALSGGPARPTFGARAFEHGVRHRPTLVQNAETLAHLALIARHGPTWFRQLGTAEDPGSALVTLSGAVSYPGVYEIEHGWPLSDLLKSAGVTKDLSAVLVGGYSGSWLPATQIPRVLLAPRHLREHAASLGAGVIVALGGFACPVAETARIADYFAAQGAGQCGPCVSGLGAIADTVGQLATGAALRTAHGDLERWASELPGRGACQHPDGAARFIASALRVFADDFRDHARRGRCERCSYPPVLPGPLASAPRRIL